jgi:hypothetical protein
MLAWIPPNDPGIAPVPQWNNQIGYRVRMFDWPKIGIPKVGSVYVRFYIVVMISQVRSYKNIPCRFLVSKATSRIKILNQPLVFGVQEFFLLLNYKK